MNNEDNTIQEFVLKHSAAVQITSTVTVMQRKIWNILLGYAYNDLGVQEEYGISLRLLSLMLDYPRNSYEQLKDSLRGLVETVVEWNILDRQSGEVIEWTACSLLAGVTISDGVVRYSYYPRLRQMLYNPTHYARIDLVRQSKLHSKHALVLYELCENYHTEGGTPWIPVEIFQQMMGGTTMEWRDVQKRLVKAPLVEVNKYTPFTMTVQTMHTEKKISHLKFTVKSKR